MDYYYITRHVITLQTQVKITITPENNTAPTFVQDPYSETLQVPKEAGLLVLDLSTVATDDDSPIFGTGEIVFSKLSEVSDGNDFQGQV